MVSMSFLGLVSGVSAVLKTTVLVVGIFEGSSVLEDGGLLLTEEKAIITKVRDAHSFTGEFASSLPIIYTPEGRGVLVVGLGKKTDELDDKKAMELGGVIYSCLERQKIKKAHVVAPTDAAARIAYGAFLRGYSFDKYKSNKKTDGNSKVEEICMMVSGSTENIVKTFNVLKTEGESIFFVRSLVTEPANVLFPAEYANRIRDELSPLGVEVEVLDEEAMKKEGMNALLGVGQGSSKASQLVVMKWNGRPKDSETLAFVGKGVTFDTGGVSLKPSKGMWDMKYDMGGSAVVVGLIRALAARQANVNVVGVVGLVENAVGGNAQRPGDIVTSMSGQTIEVLNTDAEGRLVLADALWYTQKKFAPKFIVDLATLTGAIIVALGENQYAGLFSNHDGLSGQLVAAGEAVGEQLWRMPMSEEYNKMMDSGVADVKNISTDGHGADSISAAQFLQRFIDGNIPWAHLDIAGVTWSDSDMKLSARGATGYGVMLLNRMIQDHYEGKRNT